MVFLNSQIKELTYFLKFLTCIA